MSKIEVGSDVSAFLSGTEYPDDIAQALCKIVGITDEDNIQCCTDALYQLHAIAGNPYNSDYYRVFYAVLSRLTDLPERNTSEEAEPVRLGEWKLATNNWVSSIFTCSECGREVSIMNPYFGKPTTHTAESYPYCHCGAKMVSRKENGNV